MYCVSLGGGGGGGAALYIFLIKVMLHVPHALYFFLELVYCGRSHSGGGRGGSGGGAALFLSSLGVCLFGRGLMAMAVAAAAAALLLRPSVFAYFGCGLMAAALCSSFVLLGVCLFSVWPFGLFDRVP